VVARYPQGPKRWYEATTASQIPSVTVNGLTMEGSAPVLPSPLVEIEDDRLSGARLWLKRDDLIHPAVPGNKWRKLVPNLHEAMSRQQRVLLTFGGAWSNHVRATAAAGRLWGFETIGVIRGEEHLPLNPVLAEAVSNGMRLTYMDRTTYREKHRPEVVDRLREELGGFYLVPEGGSNEVAVRSCAAIPAEIDVSFDMICCPVGTGGTLAGIASGLGEEQRALGFSVLKGGGFLVGDVEDLQTRAFGSASTNWAINLDHHFGGYARRTPDLDAFIEDFHRRHGLTLEWVYVAKMLYGVFAEVESGGIEPGTRIVAVITG
jgi:1-aminocyclopropane-1-carboxylate deaminase/D-cysteine desulfhydrase-like pyridoxal-dependent ACC family enzyme